MVLAGWYIGGLRCNVELTISHANSEKCILYPEGIKVNRAYYGDYRNKRPLFPTNENGKCNLKSLFSCWID